jgi:hypothetical protein
MCTMRGVISNPRHAKFDDALCIAVFGTQNSFGQQSRKPLEDERMFGLVRVSFVIGVL